MKRKLEETKIKALRELLNMRTTRLSEYEAKLAELERERYLRMEYEKRLERVERLLEKIHEAKKGREILKIFRLSLTLSLKLPLSLLELIVFSDETITDLRMLLGDLSRQNASATTGRDALLKVISIFSRERRSSEVEEALNEALGEEHYGITDILMIGGPAALGAYLANYYGYEWFYGLLTSLVTGRFLAK